MKNILNKIRIDNTLYLLILVALLSGYIKRTFIILLIVLVHELGHVFFFVLFNVEIESVVIYPFGGVTKVNKRIHERIYRDVLISLGGILFQLVLYVIFALLFVNGFIVKSTFEMFKTSNLSIILFNLLPIIPLDGSKLLFSLCTKFFSFKRSLLLQKVIGSFFLICFIFYTFNNGLGDVITACFLFIQLFSLFKENKYILNKFYLERVLYDNYYNGIYSNKCVSDMRIDKYYYFPEGKRYVSEKNYLIKNKF
jgi:stage IV sporulation protein FB